MLKVSLLPWKTAENSQTGGFQEKIQNAKTFSEIFTTITVITVKKMHSDRSSIKKNVEHNLLWVTL